MLLGLLYTQAARNLESITQYYFIAHTVDYKFAEFCMLDVGNLETRSEDLFSFLVQRGLHAGRV